MEEILESDFSLDFCPICHEIRFFKLLKSNIFMFLKSKK